METGSNVRCENSWGFHLRSSAYDRRSSAFPKIFASASRSASLHARRVRGRAELFEARGGSPAAVEGSGRLGGSEAEGRRAEGQVVGSLRRSGAERIGLAGRGLEPHSRRGRSALPPGTRGGDGGARVALSHPRRERQREPRAWNRQSPYRL